ncbi:MAG: hypothetical protein ACQEXN_15795 [Actinomycetota bacterium]
MTNEREALGLLVSEWTALGTVAAVIVSLSFGVVGYVRHSMRESARRKHDVRAQASKVAAWQHGSHESALGAKFTILNNSDMPIYKVCVPGIDLFDGTAGKNHPVEFGYVPPGQPFSAPLDPYHGDVSENWELIFTDAAGRRWKRTAAGELTLQPAVPEKKHSEEWGGMRPWIR